MARRSFEYNDLTNRLLIHHMDLKDVYQNFKPSQYTLVTCNPPYFKSNQRHQHQKEAHKIARHEIMCTLEDCMLATSSIKARWSAYDGSSSERLMDVLTEMRKASIEPKRVVLFIVKLINRSLRL